MTNPFVPFSVDKQKYPFLNVDISKLEPTEHSINLKNILLNENYNTVERYYFYAKYLLTNTIPIDTYLYLVDRKILYRKLKSDELIEYGKRLEEVFPGSINELIELYKNNNLEKLNINNIIEKEKVFLLFKTFFRYKLLDLIDNTAPRYTIFINNWLSYFISLPEHFFKGYLVFRCICILDANKHTEIIKNPAELAKRKVIKGDTTFHAEFPSPGDFSEIFLTKPYHNVILNQFNVDFSKADLIKSRHDFFLLVEPIYNNLNNLRTNSVSRELFRINNQKFALLGNLTIGEYNKLYNETYVKRYLEKHIKDLQSENNDLKDQIKTLQSEKTDLESKVNELENKIPNENTLEQIRILEEKSKTFEELINKLLLYKEELELSKKNLEKDYDNLQTKYNDLEKEHNTLVTSNDQLDKNYDELEKEKDELSKNYQKINNEKNIAIHKQAELIKEKRKLDDDLNKKINDLKKEIIKKESLNKQLHDENIKLKQEAANASSVLSPDCIKRLINLTNKVQEVENTKYDLYHQLDEKEHKIKKMLEALKALIEELKKLMEKMENVKTSHEDNSLLVYKLIDILKSNSDELMNNVTLNEESIKQCINDVNNTINTMENTFLL